ncbi:MAG: hypothetical protein A3C13_00720 [Candidatus Lloydbacteria bacterium RIFCSPHIGHO2_02_FULL_50_11]|nr:MAG: hypothetical protein A3C13_00720 [Candidatus Lloydbacteria bacterium RIFCSPHIGHO2_02_FULL_50_11]
MKKIIIGFILVPVIIFAIGATFVLVGGGLNSLFEKDSDAPNSTAPAAVPDEVGSAGEKTSSSALQTSTPRPIMKPNIINEPTEYYVVTGATKEEIRASMAQAKMSVFLDGHVGATSAQTKINFKRRQLSDRCEVVMTQFDLHMGFIYPKWTPPPGVSSEVVVAWDAFIAALTIHENGHAEIELRNIANTFEALKQMPSYATCDEFDSVWQAMAEKREREDRAEQARYDQETQSGKLQNVTF